VTLASIGTSESADAVAADHRRSSLASARAGHGGARYRSPTNATRYANQEMALVPFGA
jgi:hypothetical protein